jgi:hypothetical protein
MPFQVSDIFQPGTENFFSKFDSRYTFLSCKLEPNRLIIQNAVGETGCVLVNNQITNERVFFPRATRFFNAETLKNQKQYNRNQTHSARNKSHTRIFILNHYNPYHI